MAKTKKPAKQKAARRPEGALVSVHFKLTQKEYDALIKRANWWCMGNISAWLRYTGLKYVPQKDENVSQAIADKSYLT